MIPSRWRWRLVIGGLLFVVLETLFTMVDFEPDALRLGLLVAVGVALFGVVQDALGDSGPSWDVDHGRAFSAESPDRTTARYLGMLESHLTSRTPDGALVDRLRALAHTVLRQRHGLGPQDPATRELLGPELYRILEEPPRRLSRNEIDRCMTRIEEL